jgi:hypothetical protein
MLTQVIVVLLVAFLPLMMATHGVDVSSRVGVSSWQCMVNNGYTFASVRVYQSNGKPDANGPYTINDAHSGGIKYVDGYIFPCFSCGNPEGQVQSVRMVVCFICVILIGYCYHAQMDATIESLSSANIRIKGMHNQTLSDEAVVGASVGMLWIDVEGTEYWGSNQAANVDFISRITNRGVAHGVSMGIYTGKSQWTPITGKSIILKPDVLLLQPIVL